MLSLQGPRRARAPRGPSPAARSTSPPHAHVEATLAGADARVVQRSEFGALAGYFIWTAPSHAGDIRAALLAAGAVPVDARGRRGSPRGGGRAGVRAGRGRVGAAPRDRPRARGELHQGLLHRPGAGGAREVPRPRQSRADRAPARGRDGAGARRGRHRRGPRDRPRHLRGALARSRRLRSRSAMSGASTGSPARSCPSGWGTISFPAASRSLPFV